MHILGHNEPDQKAGAPTWTEEQIVSLRKLVASGLSPRTIADMLGKTRNAVIGKINRIKVKVAVPKPTPRKAMVTGQLPPMPWSGCLYCDHDNNWCGKETLTGLAWCEDHYAVVYQRPKPKLDVGYWVKIARN